MSCRRSFLRILLAAVLALSPAAGLRRAAAADAAASVAQAAGISFPAEPSEMEKAYAKAEDRLRKAVGALVSIPAQQRTFDNTVLALETARADFQDAVGPILTLADVSPIKAARDKANDLKEAADKLFIELSTREDIYRALKEYADQQKTLAGAEQRLLDESLRSFRLAGFEKRDGTPTTALAREQAKAMQDRLAEMAIAFGKNLAEYKDGIELTPERLKALGLSEEYISGLEDRGNGKRLVSIKYPDYTGFMLQANDPELQRQLYIKFQNQTFDPETQKVKNVDLLKEALDTRHRLAKLLGYETYAQYAIQYKMAQTPEKVWEFLNTVDNALKERTRALYDRLFAFKKENEPAARQLNQWDVNLSGSALGYWANRYIKERLGYDSQSMNQYFTVDSTVKGAMEIYQKLLGVEFRRIPATGTWHDEDVSLYEIKDAATKKVLSYFFLDLYPRDGKYKDFAAGEIIKGRALADGSYQKPIAYMMGNFSKPANGKSANIPIEQVETFFHEFGHIMHQALTQARYPSQSGSSVARDFVEAPSQMLENWVGNFDTLKMLSDPERPLPREPFDKMMAAKNFTEVLVNIRQVSLAMLDLTYHTMAPPIDTTKVVNEVYRKAGFLPHAEGTHFEASFGHLMEDYQAGYYGYLWSKVLAQEMFAIFKRDGMLSPAAGKAYRDTILAHGGSVKPEALVRWFLGHEPDPEMRAFLESIGASAPAASGAASPAASPILTQP